jgi:hypothetical protein
MTWMIETKPKRRFSAKLVAGLALSAMLALGTFAVPAHAEGDGDGHRGHRHNWNGGYYNAPPVVYGSPYGGRYYGGGYYGGGYGGENYGSPYYYPPPVVYGPGVGFSFHIH